MPIILSPCFPQKALDCIIIKHHQPELQPPRTLFSTTFRSRPEGFPPANQVCLFFLKLDWFNCCGTTAAQHNSYSKIRLANYANMLIPWLWYVYQGTWCVVVCSVMRQAVCRSTRSLRCEISTPEGISTALSFPLFSSPLLSAILSESLPLDWKKINIVADVLLALQMSFSRPDLSSLGGRLNLRNMTCPRTGENSMILDHPLLLFSWVTAEDMRT